MFLDAVRRESGVLLVLAVAAVTYSVIFLAVMQVCRLGFVEWVAV